MSLVRFSRRNAINLAVWFAVSAILVPMRGVSCLDLLLVVAVLPLACKVAWSTYDAMREPRFSRYDHSAALAYLDKVAANDRARWETES
jgi:hypothetical protein